MTSLLDSSLRSFNRARERISDIPNYIRRQSRRRRTSPSPHPGNAQNPHSDDRLPEEEQEFAKWRPAQLEPRTCTLTPSSSTMSLPLPYETQEQSSLFVKLPPEVRLQIWREVLGNSMVHVLLQSPGLTHVVCYEPQKPDWWRHNCVMQAWDGVCPYIGRTKDGYRADGAKLELLRSCRRIYTEAVEFLYTANVFDFSDRDRLVDFVKSIPPQRLNIIGSLNFRYFHSTMHSRDPSLKVWRSTVDIFRGMEGLKRLKIEISTEKPAISNREKMRIDEKRLLEPLKQLKHVNEEFLVEVNWEEGDESITEGPEWPFALRRLTYR